jgi:hypothetical protein
MPVPELPALGCLDHLRVIPEATEGFLYDFRATRAPARLGVTVQELSPQLAD